MFDKSKLENYQLYIEEELAEMDQVLTKYRNKQITLKELLGYFQVEWFCNYAYVEGSDEFVEVVTEEECSIHSLLSGYTGLSNLLKYSELAKWRQLCGYVEVLHKKDLQNQCKFSPSELIRHKVSEINWDEYHKMLRAREEIDLKDYKFDDEPIYKNINMKDLINAFGER